MQIEFSEKERSQIQNPRLEGFLTAQHEITIEPKDLRKLFLGNCQGLGLDKLLKSIIDQVLEAQVKEQGG